jgi:acyl carrier protein
MKPIRETIYRHLRASKKSSKTTPVRDADLLKEDLGLDSMRLVSLFTGLGDELELDILEFSDLDLTDLRTVGQLVALFEKQTQPGV